MTSNRRKLLLIRCYLLTTLVPLTAGFGIVTASPLSQNARQYNCRSINKTPRTSTIMSKPPAAELAEGAEQLYLKTPLIFSEPLSSLLGKDVYLKLDALQSSGSFKVSHFESITLYHLLVTHFFYVVH